MRELLLVCVRFVYFFSLLVGCGYSDGGDRRRKLITLEQVKGKRNGLMDKRVIPEFWECLA